MGEAPPPAIFAVFVVVGAAPTLALLGYILEEAEHLAASFITALTINFFTMIFGYGVALDGIMRQPLEASGRSEPRQGL